jgi:hypothetical protein
VVVVVVVRRVTLSAERYVHLVEGSLDKVGHLRRALPLQGRMGLAVDGLMLVYGLGLLSGRRRLGHAGESVVLTLDAVRIKGRQEASCAGSATHMRAQHEQQCITIMHIARGGHAQKGGVP